MQKNKMKRVLIKINHKLLSNPKSNKVIRLVFNNRFLDYSYYRFDKFIHRASKQVERNAKILDVGAGECPYKKYFKHTQYIAHDLCIGDESWDFSQIDINSEIYNIPLEDGSIDYILCTAVMEHLKYPHKAFSEFSRLLKSGGKIFLTTPFIWEEHQKPHDYFRYTQFAWKMLAEENNFELVEIEKYGGRFICLSSLTLDIVEHLLKDRGMWLLSIIVSRIFLYPVRFTAGFIFYFLDKLDREKNAPVQYQCIFVRK